MANACADVCAAACDDARAATCAATLAVTLAVCAAASVSLDFLLIFLKLLELPTKKAGDRMTPKISQGVFTQDEIIALVAVPASILLDCLLAGSDDLFFL
jgi:hypothetical protein